MTQTHTFSFAFVLLSDDFSITLAAYTLFVSNDVNS